MELPPPHEIPKPMMDAVTSAIHNSVTRQATRAWGQADDTGNLQCQEKPDS